MQTIKNSFFSFSSSSGSLKETSVQTGKSYPTVRNRLDDMIAHVKKLEQEADLEEK